MEQMFRFGNVSPFPEFEYRHDINYTKSIERYHVFCRDMPL